MKGVVFFAIFAVLISLSYAQNYAYLTYWKDATCETFAGVKQLGSENVTLVGTVGSQVSCDESMRCLLNGGGDGCSLIATTSVVLSVTVSGDTIREKEDGQTFEYDSSMCTQSGIFEGCYFSYFTEDEYSQRINDGVTNTSNFVLPNIAILLAVFAVFFF